MRLTCKDKYFILGLFEFIESCQDEPIYLRIPEYCLEDDSGNKFDNIQKVQNQLDDLYNRIKESL
jgi:hypothetical protein